MSADQHLTDPNHNALSDRQPPHNIPVEQALLGAVLVNNEAFFRVSSFLRPEHFFEPAHGRIYAAAGRLIERGRGADCIILAHFFERDEGLSEVGGRQYLARLAASVISVLDVEDYGRTVLDLWQRRELVRVFEDARAQALEPSVEVSAEAMIEQAEAALRAVAEAGDDGRALISMADAAQAVLSRAEAIYQGKARPGLLTGLRDLDARLGGLHDGDLIVLAGRPSMGKSSLARNIAKGIADSLPAEGEGKGVVLFFSLEMSKEQLGARELAARLKASVTAIAIKGDVDLIRRGTSELGNIRNLPFFIDDRPALTLAQIRSRAMRQHRRRPVRLVVVDHLGLVRPSAEAKRMQRVHQLGEVTSGLKAMAKELGCPVMVLSQLNRAVESREDKRPNLGDLRDSGEVEQDADVVMFLFREEYYLQRVTPADSEASDHAKKLIKAANIAEVLIPKNRMGEAGVKALLFCNLAHDLFGNLAIGVPA